MICIDTELSKFFGCFCEFNGFEIIKADNGILELHWKILSDTDVSKSTYKGVAGINSEITSNYSVFSRQPSVKTTYLVSFYTLYNCTLNSVIGEFLSAKE